MASLGKPGEMRQGGRDAWGHDAKGTVGVKKERMNRLVMNYFVTEGHVDAAREFARESGTATEVDLDTIKDRMLIRRAVQRGEVTEAMDRVNDLNPEILEHDSRLFFHLQQQRLIELIRQKEVDKALLFAQEYLAPLGEENPGETRRDETKRNRGELDCLTRLAPFLSRRSHLQRSWRSWSGPSRSLPLRTRPRLP